MSELLAQKNRVTLSSPCLSSSCDSLFSNNFLSSGLNLFSGSLDCVFSNCLFLNYDLLNGSFFSSSLSGFVVVASGESEHAGNCHQEHNFFHFL